MANGWPQERRKTTIPAYPPVAAVEEIDRPQDKGGKAGSGAKRMQRGSADYHPRSGEGTAGAL